MAVVSMQLYLNSNCSCALRRLYVNKHLYMSQARVLPCTDIRGMFESLHILYSTFVKYSYEQFVRCKNKQAS